MNAKNKATAMEQTMLDLENLVDSFNDENLNEVPFEGSWTAGQVAQHMVISNGGFLQMLNGPVEPTQRDPEHFVESLKADFLNFDIRMEAPDFTRPPAQHYRKEELLETLTGIRVGMKEAIETLDHTATCKLFELPLLGYLTRAENIAFVLYHTQRHIHQLKKIQIALASMKANYS